MHLIHFLTGGESIPTAMATGRLSFIPNPRRKEPFTAKTKTGIHNFSDFSQIVTNAEREYFNDHSRMVSGQKPKVFHSSFFALKECEFIDKIRTSRLGKKKKLRAVLPP